MSQTLQAAARKDPGLKVVEKALRVLDLFTPSRSTWTVTEISRALDLPMTTAYRIVQTLLEQGYVMRTDRTHYRLGFAAVDLGRRATASLDLRSALRPVLERLAAETGESVLLSIYDERRHAALTIDRIETRHALRLSLEIGRVTPLHAGASSKAMLAYLDESVLADTLAQPLQPLTPQTITDHAALRREIESIRTVGWAFSLEENDLGAWGVAAPVLVGDRLVAVVGVAAPTARFSEEMRDRFVQMALDAATAARAVLCQRAA